MTLSEFENTAFKPRMKAIYRSYTYRITACNFVEYLLELTDGENDSIWVRCENVELVETKENE